MRWGVGLAIFLALVMASPALGGRVDPIVEGQPASPGEYPAQGALRINSDGDGTFEGLCGGTLVSNRYFLTAAHCVIDDVGLGPLPPSAFYVYLGTNDIGPSLAGTPNPANTYAVARVEMNAGFNLFTLQNDSAMLTLTSPAPYAPLRVVGTDEGSKWGAGRGARIIGWGRTMQGGPISPNLLEADVPIISDDECTNDYGAAFDPATMVCGYDGTHDTCEGDSGGPLMVPDGGGFVLVGITSWGIGCAQPNSPGVYTRVGAPAVNQWVLAHLPRAGFVINGNTAHSGREAQFLQSTYHPEPGGFTTFNWDFDDDGAYDDASGSPVSTFFPTLGNRTIGIQATNPAGDVATSRRVIYVNGTPSAEAGGPYSLREGRSITLAGSGSDPEGHPITFEWDLNGDGPYDVAGPTPTYVARRDGPYRATLIVKVCDAFGGCIADLAELRIVNVAPRVYAGRNRRSRVGAKVLFRGSAKDQFDRLTYLWRFGDGKMRFGRRVTHRYRRPGRYRVRLLVTDDDGGVGRDVLIIRVAKRR